MRENQPLQSLIEVFSEARLCAYKRPGENNEQSFTRYQNNIRISESLLPVLHYIEIILRNRLNKAIKEIYGEEWLIELPKSIRMDDGNLAKLNATKRHYQIIKQCLPTHDDLVALMTFGFWANLFHKRYDSVLWQRKYFTVTVFPHLERDKRSRHLIKPKLQIIKDLRNRIAHHEPIWNWNPSVVVVHKLCLELVGAMSQEALVRLKEVDRFSVTQQIVY